MLIRYLKDGSPFEVSSPGDDPYKEIGQCLLDADVPGWIESENGDDSASYTINQRGTCFDRNGEKVPSMYVVENYPFTYAPVIPPDGERYLTCVKPAKGGKGYGNYKFYLLENPSGGEFYCQYGRIGDNNGCFGKRRTQEPYPERLFWIRYYEKLSKGYVDQTEIHNAPKKVVKTKAPSGLFAQLLSYSKGRVDEVFSVPVTTAMVSVAKRCLYEMRRRSTVRGFNNQLLKLLTVCPRKVHRVQDWLAQSVDDFSKIIDREESLVQAMDGAAYGAVHSGWGSIKVWKARPDQVDLVMRHLGPTLKPKVKNVYRVINLETEERYRKANHGVRKKLFWHGSRNENWLSIIKNGLQLHPNAQITGKMLGDGIYFAPSPSKSYGYTSAHGTRWANGNSNTAFMALFETAYGKPYHPTTTRQFTSSELERLGCNCVHAKSTDTWLRADEVCFYKETDVTIAYLVEFEG